MKGHVPTPDPLADHIVSRLFDGAEPDEGDRVLYPGVGEGPFVAAVERYCDANNLPVPDGVGIEIDSDRADTTRETRDIQAVEANFLGDAGAQLGEFEYVVGNPPYVPIEGIDEDEKERYRREFDTAIDRFDLYLLFFERALSLLADDGRLVFITPRSTSTSRRVAPARPPRRARCRTHRARRRGLLLGVHHLSDDHRRRERSYGGETRIMRRNGTEAVVDLPRDGSSWASTVRGGEAPTVDSTLTLGDITERVSCGVATGADRLFVQEKNEVPPQLRDDWTFPTLSGEEAQAQRRARQRHRVHLPVSGGRLAPPEDELDDFGDWAEIHRDRLEDRSCVKKNKRSWYGWHENPRWKTFSNRSSSVRISPRRRSSGSMRRATSSRSTRFTTSSRRTTSIRRARRIPERSRGEGVARSELPDGRKRILPLTDDGYGRSSSSGTVRRSHPRNACLNLSAIDCSLAVRDLTYRAAVTLSEGRALGARGLKVFDIVRVEPIRTKCRT